MIEKRRTFDRDDGAEFVVRCIQCSGATRHQVIRSVSDLWNEDTISFQNTLQIIECRGCGTLTVRHDQSSSEDHGSDYDAMTGERCETDHGHYYPPRARPELRDAQFLPFRIQQAYREILTAHGIGLTRLAIVGLRCLVDAVCDDLGQSGTLREKIDGLVQSQRLRNSEAVVLHKVRDIGNAVVHESTDVSMQLLATAIEVVEHILVSVYLMGHRADELRG